MEIRIIIFMLFFTTIFLFAGCSSDFTFNIEDKCSDAFGAILHTIDDEGICENKCRALCLSKETEFKSSSFALNEKSCNKCSCVCKN